VRLLYLLEREGWDSTPNWDGVLSLGEQQRLGMVSINWQATFIFHFICESNSFIFCSKPVCFSSILSSASLTSAPSILSVVILFRLFQNFLVNTVCKLITAGQFFVDCSATIVDVEEQLATNMGITVITSSHLSAWIIPATARNFLYW
jgi:hypothetical protein